MYWGTIRTELNPEPGIKWQYLLVSASQLKEINKL